MSDRRLDASEICEALKRCSAESIVRRDVNCIECPVSMKCALNPRCIDVLLKEARELIETMTDNATSPTKRRVRVFSRQKFIQEEGYAVYANRIVKPWVDAIDGQEVDGDGLAEGTVFGKKTKFPVEERWTIETTKAQEE